MEFFEVLRERRSVRAFREREVEPEKMARILEAANGAPSAGDLQAYRIFEVRGRPLREALASAALGQVFVAEAPVVLVFCADPGRAVRRYSRRGTALYCLQDATIACAYAQLAAAAQGLGSVWVGAFDDDAVRRVIGVGADLVPVAILPVGYAAERPAATPRRSLDDLVRRLP